MRLNLIAIVTFLGCANNAVLASTCSESAGICVCSGECPSFTKNWALTTSDINSMCIAVATLDGGGISNVNDSSVTVNGQTFTNPPDSCTDATTGSSAGLLDAFYASVMVTAAAVVGGLAAL